jgi:Domain of unknown function (DUF4177)
MIATITSCALEEINVQYKVLTQKDRYFSGKFSPEKLEEAVNGYAAEGWRAVSMATASIPGGFGNKREELIVLLERP